MIETRSKENETNMESCFFSVASTTSGLTPFTDITISIHSFIHKQRKRPMKYIPPRCISFWLGVPVKKYVPHPLFIARYEFLTQNMKNKKWKNFKNEKWKKNFIEVSSQISHRDTKPSLLLYCWIDKRAHRWWYWFYIMKQHPRVIQDESAIEINQRQWNKSSTRTRFHGPLCVRLLAYLLFSAWYGINAVIIFSQVISSKQWYLLFHLSRIKFHYLWSINNMMDQTIAQTAFFGKVFFSKLIPIKQRRSWYESGDPRRKCIDLLFCQV